MRRFFLSSWWLLAISLRWAGAQAPVPTGKPTAPPAAQVKAEASPPRPRGLVGVVLDGEGHVVPGAEVMALNDLNQVVKTSKTGAAGTFLIEDLPPGTYNLEWKTGVWSNRHAYIMGRGGDPLVLMRYGGPIPYSTLVPRRKEYVVQEWTLGTEAEARQWLDQQAKAGLFPIGVTPLRDQTSVFTFEKREPGANQSRLLPVLGGPSADLIRERVNEQKDQVFLGIHRLGAAAFLMVFRNE